MRAAFGDAVAVGARALSPKANLLTPRGVLAAPVPDPQVVPSGVEFTTSFAAILEDPEIDCVLELIGGVTHAKDIVFGAIKAGKHVVTANKALVASVFGGFLGRAFSAPLRAAVLSGGCSPRRVTGRVGRCKKRGIGLFSPPAASALGSVSGAASAPPRGLFV